MKETIVSTADPDAGIFHIGERRKCFACEAHTACDKNNFILAVKVAPGNIHGSVAFDDFYNCVICRRKRKAWNAIRRLPRPRSGYKLGEV